MMKATSRRFVTCKGSAQKVRLVADLVRGKSVNDAVAILQHTRKVGARGHPEDACARPSPTPSRSRRTLDVDDLVVRKIFVDKGPQEQRIRPAPMGRAFRVLHRKSHLTIELGQHVRAKG